MYALILLSSIGAEPNNSTKYVVTNKCLPKIVVVNKTTPAPVVTNDTPPLSYAQQSVSSNCVNGVCSQPSTQFTPQVTGGWYLGKNIRRK